MPSPPILILSDWQSRLPITMTEADPGHHPLHPQESFAPYFWKYMIWFMDTAQNLHILGNMDSYPAPDSLIGSSVMPWALCCPALLLVTLATWSLSPSQLPLSERDPLLGGFSVLLTLVAASGGVPETITLRHHHRRDRGYALTVPATHCQLYSLEKCLTFCLLKLWDRIYWKEHEFGFPFYKISLFFFKKKSLK